MLTDMAVKDYIRELASGSPTPGGGSTAALAGALGAALASMVANLTVGRKGFEGKEDEMKKLLKGSISLAERLVRLVDEDAAAYRGVITGYRMPKNTEEEKKQRSQVIQEALKQAALVPLEVAWQCLEVMRFSVTALEMGNPNVRSDARVSMLMAYAGLQSAILNVLVNLNSIKDSNFTQRIEKEKDDIVRQAHIIYGNYNETEKVPLQS